MIDHREILAYLLIGLVTFLIFSIGILTYATPNFDIPAPPRVVEETQNTPRPRPQPSQPPPSSGVGIGFQIIFNILVILVVVILVYFAFNAIRGYVDMRNSQRNIMQSKQASIQRRELEDARNRAYEILQKGLKTGKYTKSYISAYIALDAGLENYREIRRPKHITPKEYAFSVSEPVFQASVFRIVSKYYDLRYGMLEANEVDLLQFIKSLDNLFIDEVSTDIAEMWQSEFEKVISSDYKTLIPRIQDHTRPGGRI